MRTQIKYTDENGKTLVAWGAEDVTAEQIAAAMELEPETWEELTFEEAHALQQPSLEEMKEQAKQTLKTRRQGIEAGGFEFMGQHWDSEQKDEVRLNSAYRLFEELGIEEYSGWKVADGEYVTLTLPMLKAASAALMQHYGHAFAVEQAKIAEIEALESSEAVQDWLSTELEKGWEPAQGEMEESDA